MIPDNLIFINVSPDTLFFRWQQEVLITNFRKFGISQYMQVLVWYRTKEHLHEWEKLEVKYPEVKFFYYQDEGVNIRLYEPQLRPHCLKRHFRIYEQELRDKVFFYHDCDIIFRELPDFQSLVDGDVCWQSDCSSYLDYTYLTDREKKGKVPHEKTVNLLAHIGKIPASTIKYYDKNTGGAQVILKGIDSSFWKDVEQMSLDIRQNFHHTVPGSINRRYFRTENDGFQSWCADMWALNFALWRRGIKTSVTDRLNFSWATSDIDAYYQRPIMHNAGVANSTKGLFNKTEWKKTSPIGQPLPDPPKDKTSYMYVQAIREVNL